MLKDIYFKSVGGFFVALGFLPFFFFYGGKEKEKFAIISFPQLPHEKKEAQDEMNGKQRADNIFHRIYYSWLNAIKKTAFDGFWKWIAISHCSFTGICKWIPLTHIVF